MAKTKAIKVLIIDNQPLFSMGLRSLLENTKKFKVAEITNNAIDAINITQKENPALVLLEIRVDKNNGIDLIFKLKKINPNIIILVISTNEEQYYSERVLRTGARGYIMKTCEGSEILNAVNTVIEGKVYLSGAERERIFQALTGDNTIIKKDLTASIQKLSNRELQVFSLIGKGYGTIEIASKYNISTKTIDSHKEHLKLKLHCSTSQELRQLAIEWTKNN